MIQSRFTYKKPSLKGLGDYLHEADRLLKGMEGNTRRCFRKTKVTWWQDHNSPASSLIWLYNSAVFFFLYIYSLFTLKATFRTDAIQVNQMQTASHAWNVLKWKGNTLSRSCLRRAQLCGWWQCISTDHSMHCNKNIFSLSMGC